MREALGRGRGQELTGDPGSEYRRICGETNEMEDNTGTGTGNPRKGIGVRWALWHEAWRTRRWWGSDEEEEQIGSRKMIARVSGGPP